jgi:hypothetical protein
VADIRPTSSTSLPVPAGPRPAEAARTAAQRAFFQAAVARPGAPAEVAGTAPPVRAAPRRIEPVQVKTLPADGAAPPARPLRPGSLLDIKV